MIRRRACGRINPLLLVVVVALVLVAGLGAWMYLLGRPRVADSDVETITMYCAAGLRTPVEEIAARYEEEYGVKIDLQYGGSGSLLSQLKAQGAGLDPIDLYLAADASYTERAVAEGLAQERLPVARQFPVIAVAQDSKLSIASIEDLLDENIRVSMANPDQAAVGKAIQERVAAANPELWTKLKAAVTERGVFKPTVNDVAADVALGQVDAALVWNSTVMMPQHREKLRAIEVDILKNDPDLITVCVLKQSDTPTAALRFARYLTARDKGLPVFEEFGTGPVDGDVWVEQPQINFFCGAVNRKVVEDAVKEFEKREGVVVNTRFDGCGTLTGQMKTIDGQNTKAGFPDFYMACDVYYLENVKEWFEDAANVSEVDLVLVVPSDSENVENLEDILKPDVRVSIGQPDQCTIGALTRQVLQREKVYDDLMKKRNEAGGVVVEKPSSAMLVPDVATKNADVTIAYYSDAKPEADAGRVRIIPLEGNSAVQPMSVSKSSEHKYLVRRLYRQIAERADAFEQAEFKYRGVEFNEEGRPVPTASDNASSQPTGGSS